MTTQATSSSYTAENIQVLEGLQAVRRRPGMYIGTTDKSGLHHLIKELVDNAVDEAMAGYCDRVEVILHANGWCTVIDNGRGIPVDIQKQTGKTAVETVMTVLHAGGKFGGGGYKVSGGLHGVGASVVNALSEHMWVEVVPDPEVQGADKAGKVYRQDYAKGAPMNELTARKLSEPRKTGTTVSFKPDTSIFENVDFDFDIEAERLRLYAYLTKKVWFHLFDERTGREVNYYFEGGIKSFVRHVNREREAINFEPVYVEREVDGNVIECAIQYNDGFNEAVFTFANSINTIDGGSHLTGFRQSLTRVLNDYARKSKILKDNDPNLTGEDVREGLVAVVSVKLPEPQFEGQTKTRLGNPEVAGRCRRWSAKRWPSTWTRTPRTGSASSRSAWWRAGRGKRRGKRATWCSARVRSKAGPCRGSWPTVRAGTRKNQSCSSSRATRRAVRRSRGATGSSRPSCRSSARF